MLEQPRASYGVGLMHAKKQKQNSFKNRLIDPSLID